MTALNQYQKLEASALWRAAPDEQRREVIVSIGNATLVIYDGANRALGHWSLPAVIRLNPGTRPALFAPSQDAHEELELDEDEMIDAIEQVRKTIEKRRPKHGRLRGLIMVSALIAVLALVVFWLPEAVVKHGASVVPEVQRKAFGEQILSNVRRTAGTPCYTARGQMALAKLYARLLPDRPGGLLVLPRGMSPTVALPGGVILLNRTLVEDHEAPDVVAGYILAEALRAEQSTPIETLLEDAGPIATLRLLTTGKLPEASISAHADRLLLAHKPYVDADNLIAAFRRARVPSTPYAYARDITGEATLSLIEADPGGGAEILPDGDWVSLQGICGA